MLREVALWISAKWWKLLPAKMLLTVLFIMLPWCPVNTGTPSYVRAHTHTLHPTHPPIPGKFLSNSFVNPFAFSELLTYFYLRDTVMHLTDLVFIFPLATVKCKAKSSHCIVCLLLSSPYLPFASFYFCNSSF